MAKKIKILKDIGIVTIYDTNTKRIEVHNVCDWLNSLYQETWWEKVKRKFKLEPSWD